MPTFFINSDSFKASNAFVATLGAAPGSTYLAQILSAGLPAAANAMLSAMSATTATARGDAIAANLGLTGTAATTASNYLATVSFAGAASTHGAGLLAALDLFTTLQNDATFGTAATAYVARVNTALSYSSVSTNNSTDLTTLAAAIGSAGSTGAGSTFTLTTSIDSFPGTAGNDTFLGDNNTTSAADQITGGAGTDTVKIFGTNTKPTVSGIENLYYSAPAGDVSVVANAASGVVSLEIANEAVAAARTYTVTTGQAVKLTTITGTANELNIAGNTPTSVDVTVNALSTLTGTAVIVDMEGTATATLNLTASGAASNMSLRNAGAQLTKVTVAGDQIISINADTGTADPALTAVDASAMTAGGLRFTADATDRAMTITGGAGNDRINIQATLAATDTLVGGSGTDTLRISDGTDLTSATAVKVTGFEALSVEATANAAAGNTGAYAANLISGITNVEVRASGTATHDARLTSISAAAATAGINVVGNAALTGADIDELTFTVSGHEAGGTSDAATIILDNLSTLSGDGVDVSGDVTFASVDILTINSVGDGSSAAAEQNSFLGIIATDLDKLVVTGNQSVSISTAATSAALAEVDATGLTAETGQGLTLNISADAAATVLLKLSSGTDTIDVSENGTAATVYTKGGNDDLTFDAGQASTIKFDATSFNDVDVKPNTVITVRNLGAAAGDLVLNFGATFQALLKNSSGTMAAATSNQDITTAVSSTQNVGYSESGEDVYFDIDLNADGTYTASNDFRLVIVGANGASGADILGGVRYDSTADSFSFIA